MGGKLRRWTAPDGLLTLEFELPYEWRTDAAGLAASLVATSGRDRGDRRTLAVQATGVTRLDARFGSGVYVVGMLEWRGGVHVDGITHLAVFADIHFGSNRVTDDRHFEGLIVAWPMGGPEPPPPEPWPEPAPLDPPE